MPEPETAEPEAAPSAEHAAQSEQDAAQSEQQGPHKAKSPRKKPLGDSVTDWPFFAGGGFRLGKKGVDPFKSRPGEFLTPPSIPRRRPPRQPPQAAAAPPPKPRKRVVQPAPDPGPAAGEKLPQLAEGDEGAAEAAEAGGSGGEEGLAAESSQQGEARGPLSTAERRRRVRELLQPAAALAEERRPRSRSSTYPHESAALMQANVMQQYAGSVEPGFGVNRDASPSANPRLQVYLPGGPEGPSERLYPGPQRRSPPRQEEDPEALWAAAELAEGSRRGPQLKGLRLPAGYEVSHRLYPPKKAPGKGASPAPAQTAAFLAQTEEEAKASAGEKLHLPGLNLKFLEEQRAEQEREKRMSRVKMRQLRMHTNSEQVAYMYRKALQHREVASQQVAPLHGGLLGRSVPPAPGGAGGGAGVDAGRPGSAGSLGLDGGEGGYDDADL
eukprot:tig00000826_g4579.t1